MQKITCRENTYDVSAVILLRDRDAQLARLIRYLEAGEKWPAPETMLVQLNSQENVTRFQNSLENGYEVLCLILPDGRTKYMVKNAEHLDVAEEVAMNVDRQ